MAKNRPYQTTLLYWKQDHGPFAMPGIWKRWEGEDGIINSIITVPGNAVSKLYDRMPAIVPRDAYMSWLDRAAHDWDDLKGIFSASENIKFNIYPVSQRINNPRYKESDCVQKTNQNE